MLRFHVKTTVFMSVLTGMSHVAIMRERVGNQHT